MVELSIFVNFVWYVFSPEQIFWCTILTNRVKPLKCNYSSTLVIQGLLEAIAAMKPPQMFQTSLKKNLPKNKKNKNALISQYICLCSCLCVLELFFFICKKRNGNRASMSWETQPFNHNHASSEASLRKILQGCLVTCLYGLLGARQQEFHIRMLLFFSF